MLILGLAGGLDPVHDQILDVPENFTYDGAAVLLDDGAVVAAAEEERFNRIKHSNKFPIESIRFCLAHRGLRPQDIDTFAYYVDEGAANSLLQRLYLAKPEWPFRLDARTMMSSALGMALGCEIPPDKLAFYPHKVTHAASAIGHSGFDSALVYVIDSYGGIFEAGRSPHGGLALRELTAFPAAKSMNLLWQTVLPFTGLGIFEAHQAMAMAGHGKPDAFRSVFEQLYELSDGDYTLRLDRVARLVGEVPPRSRGEQPAQVHLDVAASLQRMTEDIVLHTLRHHQEKTGHRRLCLAGGMIENVSLSGRIARSGLFDQVFTHPAAWDSGCAAGAALLAASDRGEWLPREQVRHVYWGSGAGAAAEVAAELARWAGFLEFEHFGRPSDLAARAAGLLASGEVLGVVRGRAEFGSRAMGNRSVLADPRAAANRDRVGQLLGRHEPYRCYAASVTEERAADFFTLPPGHRSLPFLTFAVEVREDRRAELSAVTHVDGTARAHSVSRAGNAWYWELISAFGELTGIPVLLNTSFNSGAEPTVDSVRDAVVSLLTTDLNWMVAGDHLVRKVAPEPARWLDLEISFPPHVKLFRIKGYTEREQSSVRYELRTACDPPVRRKISAPAGQLLELADRPVSASGIPEGTLTELRQLWTERLIRFTPRSSSGRAT